MQDNDSKIKIMLSRHLNNIQKAEEEAMKHQKQADTILKKISKIDINEKVELINSYHKAAEKFHYSAAKWDTSLAYLIWYKPFFQSLLMEKHDFQPNVDSLINTYYSSALNYEKTAEEVKDVILQANISEEQIKQLIFGLPHLYGKSVHKYRSLYQFIFGKFDEDSDEYKFIREKFQVKPPLTMQQLNQKITEIFEEAAFSWIGIADILQNQNKIDEEGVTYGYVGDCYFSAYIWLESQDYIDENFLFLAIEYYEKAGNLTGEDIRRLNWQFSERSISDKISSIATDSKRAEYLRKIAERT